jgi:hypothetical protein
MIPPPPMHSKQRKIQDVLEVEGLIQLYTSLDLPFDSTASEHFERLIDLAGTREFILAICHIRQYLLKLKFAREGIKELGYIVPKKHLHILNAENPEKRAATSPRKLSSKSVLRVFSNELKKTEWRQNKTFLSHMKEKPDVKREEDDFLIARPV